MTIEPFQFVRTIGLKANHMRSLVLAEEPLYIKEIRISGGEGCPIEIIDGNKIVFANNSMGGLEHIKFRVSGCRVEKLRVKIGNLNPQSTTCSVKVFGFHEEEAEPVSPKAETTRVQEKPKISRKEVERLKRELLG